MKSRTHRITRLIRLITLLESGSGSNGTHLAQELDISRRTLFRDLRTLQEAGVPCFHDPIHGYRIARNFFLPPVNLTLSETLSLHLLNKTASVNRMHPLNDSLLASANKLISTLDSSHRQVCRDLMKHVTINETPTATPEHGLRFFAPLQRYIDESRCCRITVCREVDPQESSNTAPSNSNPEIEYFLNPYALHGNANHWSIIGLADELGTHNSKKSTHLTNHNVPVRLIPLAQVISLTPLDQRFERPDNFDTRQIVGLAWRTQPEGTTYSIELLVEPRARHLLNTRWHLSQSPTPHTTHTPPHTHRTPHTPATSDQPQQSLLCFTVDGLNEITDWIIEHGHAIRVKQPTQLREKVAARLRMLADHHDATT